MEKENAEAAGGAEEEVSDQKSEVSKENSDADKSKTAEQAADGDGEAQGAEPAGTKTAEPKPDDDGKVAKDEIPGLTESAQEKVNERIHEINIRRKNAEAALAEKEKELNEKNERLKSLEALSDEQLVNVARRVGLLPQYLEKEESKTVEEYEQLRGYRGWLRKHREGYEGTGDKDPSMTAQEVADQELKVEDRLEEIGVKARSALERGIGTLREDLAEGRKIRLARSTKPADRKITPPPVLPRGKAPAGGPLASGSGKVRSTFNQDEFIKKGANSSALEEQYSRLLS